ncbi:MAG: hypothetical protein ABJB09_04985 [Verrucomicrobiota bacterium]
MNASWKLSGGRIDRGITKRVKARERIILLGAIALAGCQTAHDVAVTSFHVIDAPAHFIRRRIDPPDATTTTTTTVTSDAVIPGRPVEVTRTTQDASRQRVAAQKQSDRSAAPHPSRSANAQKVKAKASPTPSAESASGSQQFPTAKPVPGKPGYVFSPFDSSGGYVDVNGYSRGSKVKDPYSGKVFLVP